MRIHLRYFAALRERTGRDRDALEVPDGATVATARTVLAARYPVLAPLLARCAAAVNQQYVQLDAPLNEADELVFVPPLGGG